MTHKRIIEKELEGFGIRLNQKPPNIILKRKEKGGLAITKACPLTKLDNKMITAIAKEYKISNADITFRQDANVDQLIDVIEGNRKYIPCLYVLNKCDTITMEELELLSQVPNYVPVCAGKESEHTNKRNTDTAAAMREQPRVRISVVPEVRCSSC